MARQYKRYEVTSPFDQDRKLTSAQPKWYKLKSKRKSGKKRSSISGEVQIQFSVVDPSNPLATSEEILKKFQKTVAATEDDEYLSRFTSNDDIEAEVDDDTSDETDDTAKAETPVEKQKRKKRLARLRRRSMAVRAYEFTGNSDVAGVIFAEIVKVTDLPPERNSKTRSIGLAWYTSC